MKWFKESVDWPFSCLLRAGGPLEQEYSHLCHTTLLERDRWHEKGFWRRFLRKAGLADLGSILHSRSVRRSLNCTPELIFSNTIAGLAVLEIAAKRGAKVLSYIHELEYSFRIAAGPGDSKMVLALADRFIACSKAVATNLSERHGIAENRIDIVHEHIPIRAFDDQPSSDSRGWLRTRLGIGPEAFIIGASGQPSWRKGSDLFIQLAAIIARKQLDLDVHFLWLGGDLESSAVYEFLHDVKTADLGDKVTLISTQPDAACYFRGLDLFVLPSREDPYPLVCLEAATCGIPIVCFDRAGGMPEFVEQDCGVIVPYLDLERMTNAILEMLSNSELRLRRGDAAQRKVRARHDTAIAAPLIFQAMQKTINARG